MKYYNIIHILLVIYLLKGTYCNQEYENEKINLIIDYLTYSNTPVFLTGFLCRSNEYTFKLIKTLSKNGYMSNIMFDCNMENIGTPGQHSLFLLDAACPYAENCLNMADNMKLFSAPNQWIILDRSSVLLKTPINIQEHDQIMDTQRTILEYPYVYFGNKSILSDNNILVATRDVNQPNYMLTQYYKHRLNSKIIIEHFGYWNPKNGIIDGRFNKILALRRMNLEKTVLTASIVITDNDTLNHLTDFKDPHIDATTKINYLLTDYLIDYLNGTPKYTYTSTWGYKMPDGTWNGMIGEMLSLEADLGGTALFVKSDRVSLIQYISMTTPTMLRFVFRQPPLSYVSNIFVLPFKWTVWSASIFLVVLVCFALYGAAFCEQNRAINNEGNGDVHYNSIPAQWGDVFIVALGAISQQGCTNELRTISGRIILIVLFIALMFLYTSYSANIVALLQSQSSSINTLTDLLNSRVKVGVHDTVYSRHYFPRATEPVRRALWLQKISPKGSEPHFYSLTEGLELLRKGLFAFHAELTTAYKIMSDTYLESEKCGLTEINFLNVIQPWYAVQKNSSFTEMFKIGMRRLQEFGLQARIINKLYTKKPICSITGGGGFVSVGLIEVRPALIWLASGMALSIGIFIFEKLHQSRKVFIDRLQINAYNRK